MNRLVRWLIVLGITATSVSMGVPTAEARVPVPSTSFVGRYEFHVTDASPGGSGYSAFFAKIRADGTAVDRSGHVAQWSASGDTITITFSFNGITDTYVGVASKLGIATRRHPGTITVSTGVMGKWFAVLKS